MHDLPKTYLEKLDTMADQYLKKWAGLPRCATTAVLHLRTALDIKHISTLYTETHCVTHTATRLTGDTSVNLALDNKIERESKLNRKHSVTVQAEQVFRTAFDMNTVQGEIPTDAEHLTLTLPDPDQTPVPTPHSHQTQFIKDVKKDTKTAILFAENEIRCIQASNILL